MSTSIGSDPDYLKDIVQKLTKQYQTAVTVLEGDDNNNNGKEQLHLDFWSDFCQLHISMYVTSKLQKSIYALTKICTVTPTVSSLGTDFASPGDVCFTIRNDQDLTKISSLVVEDMHKHAKEECNILDEFYSLLEPIFSEKNENPKIGNELSDLNLRPYFMDATNPPEKFKPIFEMYKYNLLGQWSVSELQDMLKTDMENYPFLHPYVKRRFKFSTTWIVVGDGYVNEKVNFSLPKKYRDSYHRTLFSFVAYLESSIHQVFYHFVLEVVTGGTDAEKASFVKNLEENKFIKAKIAWGQEHSAPYLPRIINILAMYFLEGVGFQPQFNVILATQNMSKGLPGTVFGTKLVLRDENNHQLNWLTDFKFMRFKCPEKIVHAMVNKFLEIEFAYLDDLEQEDKLKVKEELTLENNKNYEYPKDLLALTASRQKESLMYQVNLSLAALGYNYLFSGIVSQPLEFLEATSMTKIPLFFEKRNAFYYDTKAKAYLDFLQLHRNKFCGSENSLHEEIEKATKLQRSKTETRSSQGTDVPGKFVGKQH